MLAFIPDFDKNSASGWLFFGRGKLLISVGMECKTGIIISTDLGGS
jgi:hypothetical protein